MASLRIILAAAGAFALAATSFGQLLSCENPSLKPAPATLGGDANMATGATVVGGATSAVTAGAAAYGFGVAENVAKWPVARAVPVPATLGQAWVMGDVVYNVPIIGPPMCAVPGPVPVGIVAFDTVCLPKVVNSGCTDTSLFAKTDFNACPQLRSYVNYLAPMPYTHPPIYAPAYDTEQAARASAIGQLNPKRVDIP